MAKPSTTKKGIDEDLFIHCLGYSRRPTNVYGPGDPNNKLIDSLGGCRDVTFLVSGWSLFKHWYKKRLVHFSI